MPNENAILVATGRDRPGVMDELSVFILAQGGSIADTRSINLRGQFALLVLVSGTRDAMGKVRAGLDVAAERIGIDARVEQAGEHDGGDTFPYRFTATGKNHPKVLHAISHLMRVLNVNITNLQTRETSTNGPESRPFHMELGLAVPREVPIVKLREYLDALCGDMQVRYELTNL
jgi:glycine cleavage system transcriptional repressor